MYSLSQKKINNKIIKLKHKFLHFNILKKMSFSSLESESKSENLYDIVELKGNQTPGKKDESPTSDVLLLPAKKRVQKLEESFSGKRLLLLIIAALIVIGAGYGIYYITKPKENTTIIDDYEDKLNPPDVDKPLDQSKSILGQYKQAAVVSNGGPCAEFGQKILLKNGSAVEAAITTALCDGVTCMQYMGIGGGFLMTIYERKTKTATTLDARETAPAAANENMYHGSQYASHFGARSAGIPGELRGYQAAFEKYRSGNIEWHELFDPTIELCEKGVPINEHLAANLMFLEDKIRISETLSNILLRPDGTLPKLGETIKLPKLAKTLRKIAYSTYKTDELYDGSLTDAFIEDIKIGGGIITRQDMANYTVRWADPIVANLSNNLTLYTMPPPGSGALLAFMLKVLDGLVPAKGGSNVTNIQRITETFKHAYGRRTEFGDPLFVDIAELLEELSSPEYIQQIKNNISDTFTSQDYKYYGAKFDLEPDHGTANIAVLAPNGDAVSVTSTVNLVFGSLFVSNSTGIILNNEMDDFSAPNITNYFGVPPSPANFIKPGKRPMSSMAPTIIVDKNGDVRLVVGSAGGTKITTSIAYVTLLNLWFGKNIKEAIDEPRIHHQLMPMKITYEYGVLREIIEGLRKIGHETERLGKTWRSCVTAISLYGGIVEGNTDYRRPGGITGF
ncbi:scoloptoxin SSD14-like isoform X2 [Lycorma delicatula]|uniref:scoloptoxin SSD14-like isoform X2 n=1 Tax=Lycorma delicatula TaxID=130591 RepID=UPI003F51941A